MRVVRCDGIGQNNPHSEGMGLPWLERAQLDVGIPRLPIVTLRAFTEAHDEIDGLAREVAGFQLDFPGQARFKRCHQIKAHDHCPAVRSRWRTFTECRLIDVGFASRQWRAEPAFDLDAIALLGGGLHHEARWAVGVRCCR